MSAHLTPPSHERGIAEFLVRDVRPELLRLRQGALRSARFFFVRDEPRRDIRLRLRGAGAREVLGRLAGHLAPQRGRVPYAMEYRRYGGTAGLELAFQLFEASSWSVLDALNEMREGVGSAALGRGLALQFAGALTRAVFSAAEAGARPFWTAIRDGWLKVLSPSQRESLLTRLCALPVPAAAPTLTAPWLDSYQEACVAYGQALMQACERGVLTCPRRGTPVETGSLGSVAIPLWARHVHMTNNRLGLSRWDELTVAHLMTEVRA